MAICTKNGDDGYTSVPCLGRVLKCKESVDALGAVDELNALIGIIREEYELCFFLKNIQHALFAVGSQIACDQEFIKEEHVLKVEKEIEEMESKLLSLNNFIIPIYPAKVHLARAVCRRAERDVIRFRNKEPDRKFCDIPIKYLNRLGDYLFVLARYIAHNNLFQIGDNLLLVNEELWDKNEF
ncbi:MAG: cob(I)yrinic acid a,c-diamide adenosyltransferase [Synergistaceae bacterium]